ncbi:phospholipase D-like domain-containing protein [Burkholderiaceae bacterium UC74_6]
MTTVRKTKGNLIVAAHRGDAKTLLAFNFTKEQARSRLAGFTIHVKPPTGTAYYLWNSLQFEHPEHHAQVADEPPYSTANAPLHKFRWVHVPNSDHQGLYANLGHYEYTVTPRYFDASGRMQALDPELSVMVPILLDRMESKGISLGFSRGYVQSQAYVRHFGHKMNIKPSGAPLVFDTSAQAGIDGHGKPYSYADLYHWAGGTARQRIVEVLNAVHTHPTWRLDVFAYDLNEPDICQALLSLGAKKRVRVILDNAALHHDKTGTAKPEDQFQQQFAAVAGADAILRGNFGRYAHDKVFIVYEDASRTKPTTVLTGSTNFSITGLYVNANHVLVLKNVDMARTYAEVFEQSWKDQVSDSKFRKTELATTTFSFPSSTAPRMELTFSPHTEDMARGVLQKIVDRVNDETLKHNGSVLFAVMSIDDPVKPGKPAPENPVYELLRKLHANDQVFTYGISDSPGDVSLYGSNSTHGVLVTGKPGVPTLPAPFDQVPSIGAGHEIHHKFVVCGFGRPDASVVCGSSNLALGGEQVNGDNLITLHDPDIATAFAIEALLLIDHYDFLDRLADKPKAVATAAAARADKRESAKAAHWFLGTTDAWTAPYFVPGSMHARDRSLFA